MKRLLKTYFEMIACLFGILICLAIVALPMLLTLIFSNCWWLLLGLIIWPAAMTASYIFDDDNDF